MLRTNQSFLAYMEQLYLQHTHQADIVMKHFNKGERLFHQGETAKRLMVVKKGITKCFFTEENDKEFILEFLSKGEIIGEIEVIRNSKCLCNIEAMTDVTVYASRFGFPQSETRVCKPV